MGKAYLHFAPVRILGLRILGWICNGGRRVVHCRLYWQDPDDVWFFTELTDSEPDSNTQIVGRGSNYTVQIRRVSSLPNYGTTVEIRECDLSSIVGYAKSYASVRHGNLNGQWGKRCWHDAPQGYGGPSYDITTSNTYISWLVDKICPSTEWILIPKGAFGWGQKPKFPGPKHV